MFSKKQRKASRFYNDVLRNGDYRPRGGNKLRPFRLNSKFKHTKSKPSLSVIKVPSAPREQRSRPQATLGFIPRVASLFKGLFSRKVA